ncbi:hypothetical protein DE146DRAFT_681567 [Phaeosphaeria sp. MPI-PUGE-AT-0046c]|nr:hypothetical protein DE146DRAFT_681567 [Phaeosphaeria sp. MPI-PUGE-AT-0046c]
MNLPPFALFVLTYILIMRINYNEAFEDACSWNNPTYRRQPDNLALAPVYRTEPPISKLYTSPWYGEPVDDCAEWSQAAPDDVASDKTHFDAMNYYSKKDDTILLGNRFEESFGGYQRRMEDKGKLDRSQGGPYS